MIIDATVLFDFFRLIVNRSDEKIRRLADSIFDIYAENLANITSSDIKYCELYISLCKEVLSKQLNISDHRVDIVNIIKRNLSNPIFKKDNYIKEAMKSIAEGEIDPSRIVDITKRMNNIVSWHLCKRYITKMYGKLKESSLSYSTDDQDAALTDVKDLITEFKNNILELDSKSSKGGPVEVINMDDKDSIRSAFRTFRKRRVDYVLKSGWQGVNMMFGPAGGAALGESIIYAARNHNFKSGILMKWAHWIAAYNEPPPCPGKKPMILIVSLENEGYQNMMKLFELLYISINKTLPPVGMSEDEVVESIYSYFEKSPYTLVVERYLPSNFGYDEFVHRVEEYADAGFQIVSTIVDYVGLMRTHYSGSASRSGDHTLLQELYNRMVNYCKAQGITLFSAAQLNRGASDIAASGVPHPVKLYSERHLAGSTGIAREVDMLVYQEIEKDEQGKPWLTMCWAKHRYVDNTVESHKFCCYPFDENVGIVDDIYDKFAGVRNIYKARKGGESTATAQDISDILGLNI